MKELNIIKSSHLPVDFLSLRKVIFGGSGAGKTTCGRVIFEEATKVGAPCGVIDLKGDWWGLKSSADGLRDGIPVIIFGGDHQDVPIDENGGAELAEIVAELRQPFIIDLEQFSKSKQLKFLAPFFDRLYDKNRKPLVLICDEADRYIPQRFSASEGAPVAICNGAGQDIAKRGRKHGIFPMFISQRNADLSKSVTELCEVALVFRTSGPNDQKAVSDWFDAKGNLVTEDQKKQVMDNISGLMDGEVIICSAHPKMKMFKQSQIRFAETFDSSATPDIGKELIQPKKFAKIELTALSERMKITIEQAKANDPAELKRDIARLKKELVTATNETKKHEVFSLSAADLKKVDDAAKLFEELNADAEKRMESVREIYKELNGLSGKLGIALSQFSAQPQRAGQRLSINRVSSGSAPVAAIRRPVLEKHSPKLAGNNGSSDVRLPIGERKVLEACIQYADGLRREQLTVLTGYRRSSRDAYIQRLREKGFVEINGDLVQATQAGVDALPDAVPLPTGEALQDFHRKRLPTGELAIFDILLEAYPESVSREDLSERTTYQRSSRDAYIQRMRAKQILTEPSRGHVRAADELFD